MDSLDKKYQQDQSPAEDLSASKVVTLPSYRILPPSEWERLLPVFKQLGQLPPESTNSFVAVAESDGDIQGLLVLQPAWHMEPIILLDSGVSFRRLIETLETVLLPGGAYYSFSPSQQIDRLCEANKMQRRTWSVYQKQVGT